MADNATFEIKKIENKNSCFLYHDGGEGMDMHFAHANGFPAGVYEHMLGGLEKDFRVMAMNFCCQLQCSKYCGMHKPEIEDWTPLADELIEFLDLQGVKTTIGVGHSLGAVVTVIASVKRPDLFKKIILLDPVFLSPNIVRIVKIGNLLRQQRRMPLAVKARNRKDLWESRAEALEYFRGKPLFEKWEERALESYVNHGLYEAEEGFRLMCPPECEARIFETFPVDIWKWVKKINVPATLIRGERSDVMKHVSWSLFGRLQPKAQRINLGGQGHLFPMQKIDRTIKLIKEAAHVLK